MTEITDFSQLEPGKYYNVHCEDRGTINKCQFVCDDTTPLKRDITYWQFDRPGINRLLTKDQLRTAFDQNRMLPQVFAMWQWELKYRTTITTIE